MWNERDDWEVCREHTSQWRILLIILAALRPPTIRAATSLMSGLPEPESVRSLMITRSTD
jgi:hypothetical protein